jgi:hypothetical protein
MVIESKTVQDASKERARASSLGSELAGISERPRELGLDGALLSLQRSHGNRFVQRLVSGGLIQRKCSCAGTCEQCRSKDEGTEEMIQRRSAGGGNFPTALGPQNPPLATP